MTIMNVIILIIACAIAAGLGFYLARSSGEPIRSRLERERDELGAKLSAKDEVLEMMTTTQQEVQLGLGTATQQLAGASDRSAKQTNELSRLQQQLEELQGTLAERERQLAESRENLRAVREEAVEVDLMEPEDDGEMHEELHQQRA